MKQLWPWSEVAMYKLRSKIWLEDQGKVFGDGPCELLEKVDRMGSLRKAAADMRMSYRQAWDLIKMLEGNLGFSLMERKAGGSRGGGSSLTKEGRVLMLRFRAFRRESNKCLDKLFIRYFGDDV